MITPKDKGGTPMKIDRKTLKQAARQNMRNCATSPMKVTLLFLFLTTVVSLLVDFMVANPAATLYQVLHTTFVSQDYEHMLQAILATGAAMTMLTVFLNILMFLYRAVMGFGYYAYTLRRTDGEDTGGGDLLCGFSQVGRVILMQLVVMGFTIVWTLATVIPASTIGSIFLLIMIVIFGESMVGMVISLCVFYVLIIVAAVFAVYLTMRYTMAPFILADDPAVSGMEAVRRSRALMRGRLGEGFKLQLSFIGWGFLRLLIMVVVATVVFVFSGVAYYMAMDRTVLVVGAYVLAVADTLVLLPFNMWYVPYHYGAFAQYYRAISPKQQEVQRLLEADRPEPF